MKKFLFLQKEILLKTSTVVTGGIVLGASIGYAGYVSLDQHVQKTEVVMLEGEVLALREQGIQKDQTLIESEETINGLERDLEEYRDDNDDLEDDLKKAERRYEEIEESVGEALGTVEFLNKKSKRQIRLL